MQGLSENHICDLDFLLKYLYYNPSSRATASLPGVERVVGVGRGGGGSWASDHSYVIRSLYSVQSTNLLVLYDVISVLDRFVLFFNAFSRCTFRPYTFYAVCVF